MEACVPETTLSGYDLLMNTPEPMDLFFGQHPELRLTDEDARLLASTARVQDFPAGAVLVGRGAECSALPFVLRGNVKVHRSAENGREVVLYHIQEGQSCILSALGIVNGTAFPALAELVSDSSILLVPARTLVQLIDRNRSWRNYVLAMYNDRLGSLLELVDEILFHRVDVRLARFLLERVQRDGVVADLTHSQIAQELGSSREVVSRVLRSLQERDLISYGRGRIDIVDLPGIRKLSDP